MSHCPISDVRSDLYLDRIEAFIAAGGIAFFAMTCTLVAPLLLMLDYLLKIATKNRAGLLRPISLYCKRVLGLEDKWVDDAPKRFARVLGAVMMANLTIFYFLGLHSAAVILSAVFISFALLEAFFCFCIGCRLYTWIQRARSR